MYWALTALPNPLIDPRPQFRADLDWPYLWRPELLKARDGKVDGQTAARLLGEFLPMAANNYNALTPGAEEPAVAPLAIAAAVMAAYPEAKTFLRQRGLRPPPRSMPCRSRRPC